MKVRRHRRQRESEACGESGLKRVAKKEGNRQENGKTEG